jgi:hypothetical protein
MHAVLALKQSCKGSVWEKVLHFEKMDQLRHLSALLDDCVEIFIWVNNELFDGLLVCKYTVLLLVFKDTEIWLSRHQETLFNNVDKAETEEIQRDMHEIRSVVRHQTDDTVAFHLRLHRLSDVFLNYSLLLSLLHVLMLSFSDQLVWKSRCHKIFELKQHLEELLSQDGQVLLLEKLGVDLRELIELGVNLILWDRALVSDEVLKFSDFLLILLLEVVDVLLGDLDITLELEDIDKVLTLVSQLLLVVFNFMHVAWVFKLIDDIEEHGVFVRLLHDFGDFIIQI